MRHQQIEHAKLGNILIECTRTAPFRMMMRRSCRDDFQRRIEVRRVVESGRAPERARARFTHHAVGDRALELRIAPRPRPASRRPRRNRHGLAPDRRNAMPSSGKDRLGMWRHAAVLEGRRRPSCSRRSETFRSPGSARATKKFGPMFIGAATAHDRWRASNGGVALLSRRQPTAPTRSRSRSRRYAGDWRSRCSPQQTTPRTSMSGRVTGRARSPPSARSPCVWKVPPRSPVPNPNGHPRRPEATHCRCAQCSTARLAN